MLLKDMRKKNGFKDMKIKHALIGAVVKTILGENYKRT